MTLHNYLQRRAKLLKAMRVASDAYLWHCNDMRPQGKRAATLAAKRLKEGAADLYRLQSGIST